MATQAQRREKTRGALLTAARRLFLEQGYGETSTAEILEAAGVSKGALYHHFAAKEEIMAAIFTAESQRAIAAARAAIDQGAPPLEQLRQSARGWMAEIRRPETAKILLELGPSALGRRRAKAIEDDNSRAAMIESLERAAAAGEIDLPSIEVAARLLNAVLTEAAFLHLQQGEAARAAIDDGLDRFIKGLSLPRSGI